VASLHQEQLTHLQRLANELQSCGFVSRLLDSADHPSIKVCNPDTPDLNERILCRPADDGSWCFWWPWQQPIGSTDDLLTVITKITTVLRSVQGGQA
jgi:hypothetical protein